MASVGRGLLTKMDAQTNQVVSTLTISNGPAWMSYGAGSPWVCGYAGGVSRLDPSTNQVVKSYDLGPQLENNCAAIAARDNTVWVEVFKAAAVILASRGSGALEPAGFAVAEVACGPQVEAVHRGLACWRGPQGRATGLSGAG